MPVLLKKHACPISRDSGEAGCRWELDLFVRGPQTIGIRKLQGKCHDIATCS